MQYFCHAEQWMTISLSSDGCITSISNTVEQIIGYSPHELVGQPIASVLADESVFAVAQTMKTASAEGAWEGKIVHRERSGKPLPAHAWLTQLNGRENRCAGFLLLSAFKPSLPGDAAEPRLLEVAAHLRKTAHELNNSLAVMMGFTQLVLLDPQCEGKIRTDLDNILAETKRVIQIVEKVHTYALSLQQAPVAPESISK
jgi:PAS domain S-box-containing protein